MLEHQSAEPTIRAAIPEDIPGICNLLQPGKNHEKDVGLRLEQFSDSSTVFVAVNKGLVRGVCIVRTGSSGAEGGLAGIVQNLVVHPDYSGEGIGGSLVGCAMNWSTKQGLTRLAVTADKDSAPSLQFYFPRGWTDTGSIYLKNRF